MTTLAPGGRVTVDHVDEEIARLLSLFAAFSEGATEGGTDLVTALLGQGKASGLDRFDRVQLEEALRVCRRATSLSDAGRLLFAASRAQKKSVNDADRLRKYLARFDLTFAQARGGDENFTRR